MSDERLGDLSSEWVNAPAIGQVGCGGNRDTEIRERQERDGAARGTAAVTDHSYRRAGDFARC